MRIRLWTEPSTPPEPRLAVIPVTAHIDGGAGRPTAPPGRGWLHYSNLKVEAAVFLLIALTFVAVLFQGAVTSQRLTLTPHSAQYYPYTYGDNTSGGKSTVTTGSQPLTWSCTLRPVIQYPFCGYGLQLDAVNSGKGLDFSHLQTVTLKLNYHGAGNRLRMSVRAKAPEALAAKARGETVPMTVEFDVVQGINEVHVPMGQLAAEQWWISAHDMSPEEARFPLKDVTAIDIVSANQYVFGSQSDATFDVAVESLDFHGAYLSTAQWYLIILGAWLVATGGFLVYRFFGLRRGYEQRQRHQAEEARVLAEARAAAEEASAAKSQFLANMSHELRTPLNAILGYADLLKDSDLSERQKTAIRTIQHSGEHLLTMITDILDIAKVEAGKLELLPGAFDMRACVNTVAQMIALRAQDKGLVFAVHVADDVPQNVIADQKRIRQVLINLLVNAVKFTPEGEVRLDVSVSEIGQDQVRLRFDISDTGIGIAPDHIGRIFRPFEQAGNSIARSGGTGLGLSITHQIVTMMDGDITVESQPGAGSRFRVELALAVCADTMALPEPGEAPAAALEAPEPETPLVAPPADVLEGLLALARAGNLRAIRKEVEAIKALGPQYHGFADRLDGLAAAWQSPAVLRLIEQSFLQRDAA